MKVLLALSPAIFLFLGYVYHYNNVITGDVVTIEDCVTNSWMEHESRTGTIPSVEAESKFREECWASMGANINSK